MDRGSTVTPIKAGPQAELEALRQQYEETGGLPPTPEMKVTREQMKIAKLPLSWRDYCAHLLIPLNKCRQDTWYCPWKCEHERHEYEKCQYDEYVRRMAIQEQRMRESAA
mmetsp:Transcript_63157/g.105040  ORF Transcript_63157/g.105040 Transcript_63157/m.105040 type:complete len:110 (+) Transcript_63157:65-394(+)|eukprot:CAMPEP_0119304508 /NCGR_PEP_ID=MMETSP1333-20130426/5721_1 /TAXON_ID=418940 /ORGANISM="Scyphosphaera apsteinii, Strain RCC1455" /LENGTH=109 /DNA_ID=CAMNT_0007307407 /DNA_START=63 /DNA_END=392 /DNA_ORIENTATION=+